MNNTKIIFSSRLMIVLTLLCWLLPATLDAAGTYTLVKVTQVTDGEKYVFEQQGCVMNNIISSKSLKTTDMYISDKLNGSETYVWTLVAGKGGYYMKTVNDTYLSNTYSTNLALGKEETASIWAFTFDNGTATIQNKSFENRFLGFIISSREYRAYAASNLGSTTTPHAISVYELREYFTASFSVNGTISSSAQFARGTNVNFPTSPANIEGKTFVGWSTCEIDGKTDKEPDLLADALMPKNDVTYHAVFADVTDETTKNYCTTVDENHPVTISASAKYATYSATQPSDFSKTGATVFTARVCGGGVLLSRVADGIVPANEGVILFKDVSSDEAVSVPATTCSLDRFTDNELLVSDGTVNGDGSTIYALANKTAGVGFYLVKSGLVVPSGRPYLKVDEAAAREFLDFISETDGITEPASTHHQNHPCFDLSGRVANPDNTGFYIMNGKKVFTKRKATRP